MALGPDRDIERVRLQGPDEIHDMLRTDIQATIKEADKFAPGLVERAPEGRSLPPVLRVAKLANFGDAQCGGPGHRPGLIDGSVIDQENLETSVAQDPKGLRGHEEALLDGLCLVVTRHQD